MVKQRGNGFSIKIAYFLYKIFGYNLFYYFLYPITLYYLFFAPNVKHSLREFYNQIVLKFNNKIYFKHLRTFALCLTDRFLSKKNPNIYNFIVEDKEKLLNYLRDGVILLFSHYGGWASLSNALKDDTIKINMVMQEAMIDSIKSIENSFGIKDNIKVIDINSGAFSVAISIANALSNKEVVGIMADRAIDERAKVAIEFFSKEAYFNKNPFDIAKKTNTKMLAIFVTNSAKLEYRVDYKEVKSIQEYVKFYESFVIKYPNHWFNFYNFWSKDGTYNR